MLQKIYSLNKLKEVIRSKYHVYNTFLHFLVSAVPRYLLCVRIEKNEIEVEVQRDKIVDFLAFLKDHTWSQYKVISDIIAVDYPGRKSRFDVIYQLLSLRYNTRVNILVSTNEIASINSVTSLYKGANWYEREV